MEKCKIMKIKTKLFTVILFISILSFSQSSKNRIEKITISKKEIITDVEKKRKSQIDMFKKMASYQYDKKIILNETDSSKTQVMNFITKELENSDIFIDDEEDFSYVKFIQKINDNTLTQYFTHYDEVIQHYEVFDLKNESYKLIDKDSVTIINKIEKYTYYDDKILSLKIDKKITKKVLGFNCFQVIIEYKEFSNINDKEDLEFEKFISKFPNKMKLWVTEDFILKYHPIIKFQSILEKYYPLEIQIISTINPYSIQAYYVKEIKLKN